MRDHTVRLFYKQQSYERYQLKYFIKILRHIKIISIVYIALETCSIPALTLIFLMIPPAGLKELNRIKRSSTLILSQSMLHTASLGVISEASGASLSISAHLWSNVSEHEKMKHHICDSTSQAISTKVRVIVSDVNSKINSTEIPSSNSNSSSSSSDELTFPSPRARSTCLLPSEKNDTTMYYRLLL